MRARVFVSCGVRYLQLDDNTVRLSQQHYALSLQPIVSREIQTGQPETPASDELKGQYMSVLGALAYLMITRIDLAVYVAALQRAAHAPTVAHAKRLNVLVRYVQRTPVDLVYRKLQGPVELLVMSDSSFKRETDTGHAMKGYLIVLHSSTTSGSSGQPVANGNS